MQARVVREIDDAHAAAAEDALDAIGADLRAFGQQRRRLEKAVAVVVRLQQREHFVLDVGGSADARTSDCRSGGGVASARSNNAPTRCQRSASLIPG